MKVYLKLDLARLYSAMNRLQKIAMFITIKRFILIPAIISFDILLRTLVSVEVNISIYC